MKESEIFKVVEVILNSIHDNKPKIDDINLNTAKALIEEIENEAIKMGVSAVIAISNAGAHPVAVHCMDGAYIASFDIALNKAYTVVALKMSTKELKALSQPGQSLHGITNTNHGRIIALGGGDLLMYEGEIIGGLGVSGGSEEEDIILSEYGRNKLTEVLAHGSKRVRD